MDNHLVSLAEAERLSGVPERTLRRWAAEDLIDRYWWEGRPAKGPRVSLEQIEAIRAPIPSGDGSRTYSINTPRRGYVTIVETDSAATFGAVALYDAVIDRACAHPDGLLVLTAGQIGKITRNDKGAWTYGCCSRMDLELAGVAGMELWEAAADSLRAEIVPFAHRG